MVTFLLILKGIKICSQSPQKYRSKAIFLLWQWRRQCQPEWGWRRYSLKEEWRSELYLIYLLAFHWIIKRKETPGSVWEGSFYPETDMLWKSKDKELLRSEAVPLLLISQHNFRRLPEGMGGEEISTESDRGQYNQVYMRIQVIMDISTEWKNL